MVHQIDPKSFINSIEDLKKYIKLNPREEKTLKEIEKIHPIRITKYYMSLINPKDSKDPLRQMVVPNVDEFDLSGSYDVSGEAENTKTTGLQHKYPETALILATNRCAAYCRHCFRKRFIGLPSNEILSRFDLAINYIKKHKEIDNVLITGGDPLVLKTEIIKNFLNKLTPIGHLKYIRFGSRVPVVLPRRIYEDKKLLHFLHDYSKNVRQIYIVTHFNHPREITKESKRAIQCLKEAGIIINNQTVLLRGVNDASETLAKLMKNLVSIGVNPYYVFQCRPVKRVKKHFQVPLQKGLRIVEEAKKHLDGHSKRFKYCMSHKTGKVEILGILNKYIYFKYNEAKNLNNKGKFFRTKLKKNACWLDELT
ncbi:MAG: KamA family radical SAM protein [Nanoarchaeota archaeon]|nr:KamA family radical SAM protein [Nanoarchaeota archaeon]